MKKLLTGIFVASSLIGGYARCVPKTDDHDQKIQETCAAEALQNDQVACKSVAVCQYEHDSLVHPVTPLVHPVTPLVHPVTTVNPPYPLVQANSWMQFIPDETPINQINMPGTHDSGAYDSTLPKWFKTQYLPIKNQINECGSRLIDARIRARFPGSQFKEFRLAHGKIVFDITLASLMDDCVSFLDTHPSETIILHLWPEKNNGVMAQASKAQTAMQLKIWLNALGTSNWKDHVHHFGSAQQLPQIGDVRSKIVLMTLGVQIATEYSRKSEDYGEFNNIFNTHPRKHMSISEGAEIEGAKLVNKWEENINDQVKLSTHIDRIQKLRPISSSGNSFLQWHSSKAIAIDNPNFPDEYVPGTPIWWAGTVEPYITKRIKTEASAVYKPVPKPVFLGPLVTDFISEDNVYPFLIVLSNIQIAEKIKAECRKYYEAVKEIFDIPATGHGYHRSIQELKWWNNDAWKFMNCGGSRAEANVLTKTPSHRAKTDYVNVNNDYNFYNDASYGMDDSDSSHLLQPPYYYSHSENNGVLLLTLLATIGCLCVCVVVYGLGIVTGCISSNIARIVTEYRKKENGYVNIDNHVDVDVEEQI
eukprot:17497_1